MIEKVMKIPKKEKEVLRVKKHVMLHDYKMYENCIVYAHAKEISFNWRSYDRSVNHDDIAGLAEALKEPLKGYKLRDDKTVLFNL